MGMIRLCVTWHVGFYMWMLQLLEIKNVNRQKICHKNFVWITSFLRRFVSCEGFGNCENSSSQVHAQSSKLNSGNWGLASSSPVMESLLHFWTELAILKKGYTMRHGRVMDCVSNWVFGIQIPIKFIKIAYVLIPLERIWIQLFSL